MITKSIKFPGDIKNTVWRTVRIWSRQRIEISFLLDKIIQPKARVMMDSSLKEHLTEPLAEYDRSVYNRIADALSDAPVQSAYVDYFDAQFYFYLKLDHDIDLSFSCFCESDADGDTDDDIMLSLEFKTRKGELIRSDSMFLEQLVEALDDIFRTLD